MHCRLDSLKRAAQSDLAESARRQHGKLSQEPYSVYD